MTDTVGASLVRYIAKISGDVPIQDFIVRNDAACGSTIGPMIAAKAGLKTVDIGAPMLGMHSIRETCGVIDLWHYRQLFEGFYRNYHRVDLDILNE
jgi:aspartyl aminopeptidase